MSEIISSLINNGPEINSMEELDYSPYNCFKKTIESEPEKFRIAHLENKIPMVFSIVAQRNKTIKLLNFLANFNFERTLE